MIFIDSREKPAAIKRTKEYFDKHNIDYAVTKLYVGDYQRADNGLLLIDRKQGVLELANNATQGHERFKRELCRLDGIKGKMYILVEENLSSLEDINDWISPTKRDGKPYTNLEGRTLYKILASWKYKHNIEFIFCHKNSTGKVIAELLGVK